MKKAIFLFIFSFSCMCCAIATTLHVEQLNSSDLDLAVKQIGKFVIKGKTVEFYDRQGTLLHSFETGGSLVMTFDEVAEETDFGTEEQGFESLFHSETTYSIYPNPTSTAIMVNGLEKPTMLRLYSLEGKLIKSAVGTSINVTDIPDGNYLLQCENQILRVIKQ